MNATASLSRFRHALPFWAAYLLVPVLVVSIQIGGWALILPPAFAWWFYSILDAVLGRNTENPDPETPDAQLFWYKLNTWLWLPIQILLIYGSVWYVTQSDMSLGEKFAAFFGVGVITGSVGIVYAHELLHQSDKFERLLADMLLATVLYSHFRTEHLLVHHPWVGTRRDLVTARYNEGFHRYFVRVLAGGMRSAWRAEKAMLARRDLSALDGANPFWHYIALQTGALILALAVGGWEGLGFFAFQALVAIWLLELTNYVEHYGLTRKYLGDGKYEPVRPHHSWNADHRATNWQFINLQRHSDHHYKPARRYPLLQTYPDSEAPQLPLGYPIMALLAMVPPLWRRVMNPKVRKWRQDHYPEITDWAPYKRGDFPPPVIR